MSSFKPFRPPTLLKNIPTTGDDSHPAKRRKISDENDHHNTGRLSSSRSSEGTCSTPLKSALNNPPGSSNARIQNNAGVASKPGSGELEAYYQVLWRKVTTKKNKTWDGDGILAVHGGYAYLQDVSGRDMGKTACSGSLSPETTLSIAGKEVEVQDAMPKSEYVAGRHLLGSAGKTTVQQLEKKLNVKVNFEKKPVATSGVSKVEVPVKNIKKRKQASETDHERSKLRHVPNATSMSTATTHKFKNPLIDQSAMPKVPGEKPTPRHDPTAPGALVLKRPATIPHGKRRVDVVVDPLLSKSLRKHQREGVEFLYECCMGMRHYDGEGAILADEMGLGKTLQVITLLWTLLKQNPVYEDGPVIKKALIICPVTLINNWRKEFRKWLGIERVGVFVMDNSKRKITDFTHGRSYNIMIIGYERFLTVHNDLQAGAGVDIVIADEGHRLKTAKNKCAQAIKALDTPRKIVLSGTPLQNDLTEFYFMVDLVNPGVLGKPGTFKSQFENPILKARQPEATAKDIEKGEGRSEALADLTALFILRRTSEVLVDYLPEKTEYILFCRPTATQASIYRNILTNPAFGSVLRSSETSFQLITILKKLCNSPSLLKGRQANIIADSDKSNEDVNPTITQLLSSIPPSSLNTPAASGKLRVLDSLLHHIRTISPSEKVVIVSHYTSTLDIIGTLVASLGYPFLRLDGSTPQQKRQELVDTFNRSSASSNFAFLMSAKAGGVGINLIGASRLILFDVDWNPATETQAMARIHRDGQKRHCRIYRLLTTGALDERIFQRQLMKTGLADAVVDGKGKGKGGNAFTADELRDLFTFREGSKCLTHELLGCECGGGGVISATLAEEETKETKTNDNPLEDESSDEDDIFLRRREPMKASEVDMNAQEQKIKEFAEAARSKATGEKKDIQALMRWAHIDTAALILDGINENGPERDTADVDNDDWQDIDDVSATMDRESGIAEQINDNVLIEALKDDRKDKEEARRVSYMFVRRTGAKM